MNKKLICIECPKGCALIVTIDANHVISVTGNECKRGEQYAHAEISNPMRIVTSTVKTKGLALSLIPVRTDSPIPKHNVFEVMKTIQALIITSAVTVGDILIPNVLGLGANVIATRDAPFKE